MLTSDGCNFFIFSMIYLVPERKPANFLKFEAGDNFNRKCPAGNALGVNTLSILRIKI